MTARVALATASAVGDLDEDMAPLLAALGDRGVEGHVVVWDDPAVGWGSFDLVVVRSTWDYAWRRDEFLAWAEGVAAVVTLSNPAPVLRWNTDKHYLRDLEAAGVAVVPTCFVVPGAEAALPPTGEYVVKPVVSAGAKDTVRYGEGPAEVERARALLGRLADSGRSAMVQPYLHAVDEAGETALIFLGGAYSHAIRKGPILAPGAGPVSGLYAEEHIEARTPSGAERSSAARALAAVPGAGAALLYARVDLVPGDDGEPLVLEVELTEPSLFLDHAPGSADRLVAAIARQARRGR